MLNEFMILVEDVFEKIKDLMESDSMEKGDLAEVEKLVGKDVYKSICDMIVEIETEYKEKGEKRENWLILKND